jgi:hypothetical protein
MENINKQKKMKFLETKLRKTIREEIFSMKML